MRVNEINEMMAISDTSDFEQDERSFQPLIYLEYVLSVYNYLSPLFLLSSLTHTHSRNICSPPLYLHSLLFVPLTSFLFFYPYPYLSLYISAKLHHYIINKTFNLLL